MKTLNPLALPESFFSQLKRGAFLTVKAGTDMNTMTIGWGLVGVIWQRPVFMVAVRDSRHTFALMERAQDFSVSVPTGDMKDALAFCGSRSGREVDKFAACGLATRPGQRIVTPVLEMPGQHLECRIVHKAPMDPSLMDRGLEALYPEKDYHTLYFGEILACCEQEGC